MNRKHFIVLFFLVAGIYACNKETIMDSLFEGSKSLAISLYLPIIFQLIQ
jgi:hypothetical protein